MLYWYAILLSVSALIMINYERTYFMEHPIENHVNHNPEFIHHTSSPFAHYIRNIVFGIEDGMVSTLGTLTGIAVGSREQATVLLAGFVIIAVESISMGIGSYLSQRSEEDVKKRKLNEEQSEIEQYPAEEREELLGLYCRDGWPKPIARKMAEAAAADPKLMLKEMALRELRILPSHRSHSLKGGLVMFASYIVGGLIPLASYLVLPIAKAIPLSIIITLIGLFILGALTTRLTKQSPLMTGLRMLTIGGIALAAGVIVGLIMGS